MKKKVKNFFADHITTILVGILIVVTFVITDGMIRSIKNNIENFRIVNPPSAEITEVIVSATVGEEYSVREFEGRIGVFLPDDNQPFRIEEVYVAYLPDADKERLRGGITVYGQCELEKILSDLCS